MFDVFYIGDTAFVPELLFHHQDYNLKGILVESDRLTDDLLSFALVRGVPLHKLDSSSEIDPILKANKVDFCLMFSFGWKVPESTIEIADVYNIHTSALPNYKGRHPTFWATLNNEKDIGITLHKVSKDIDCGEIISQRSVPYMLWMQEDELMEELYAQIPELLDDLPEFLSGNLESEPNSEGGYFAPVKEADYTIDLSKDSPDVVFNKVRAQVRYRGAKLPLSDGRICWLKEIIFTSNSPDSKRKVSELYESEGKTLVHYNDDVSIRLIEYELEGT